MTSSSSPGPYSIGSDHWGGTSKLIEEIGELLGALSGGQRSDVRDEAADVVAACAFFAAVNDLDLQLLRAHQGEEKIVSFSFSPGTLLQVLGKIIGVGGGSDHWDGAGDLRIRAAEAVGATLGSVDALTLSAGLRDPEFRARVSVKVRRFLEWHAPALERVNGGEIRTKIWSLVLASVSLPGEPGSREDLTPGSLR